MLTYSSLPFRTCLSLLGSGSGLGCRQGQGALRFYLASTSTLTLPRLEPVPCRNFQSSSVSFGVGEVGRRDNCNCSDIGLLRTAPMSKEPVRFYASTKQKPWQDRSLQEVSEREGGAVTLSTAEKVKENVKTASYGGVIVVGVVIGGAMLYFVMNELLSSESPNNIYSHAFKTCKLSTEVQDALGTPIKCYGEETRRGWRRHVAFQEFLGGETKFLRMKFYIEGPFKKGTVNLEKKANDRGKYEYTYIIVDVDGYPQRRINVPF